MRRTAGESGREARSKTTGVADFTHGRAPREAERAAPGGPRTDFRAEASAQGQ